MINVCINCGEYHEDKIVNMADSVAICPNCGYAHELKMYPLFALTGASGVGKSTIGYHLAQRQQAYAVLEMDMFWRDEFNTPDNDYYDFRNLLLRVANNFQQTCKPVVIVGSSTPGSYEKVPHARYFSSLHYLALVCDEDEIAKRLRARPSYRQAGSEEYIQSMLAYNQWFKDNVDNTNYDLTLLDTSNRSIDQTVDRVLAWLNSTLK